MDKTLKPYLTYSAAIHLFAAIAGFKLLYTAAKPAGQVYSIDFIGPSAAIIDSRAGASGKTAPAPPAAKAPAPKAPDDFSRRPKHGGPLPKPSLSKGYVRPNSAPAPAESSADEAPSEPDGASGAPGSAGIATDMPNFPYPWYISQVRAALWEQWTKHKPRSSGEAVVSFNLMPNGRMTDLRIEVSSGDSAFDLAAMGTAQDASPFPPLPRGFTDPFLRIHVTLKS